MVQLGVCRGVRFRSLMASRRAHGLSTVEAIWATARPRRLAILSVPGISVLGMKYGCHCPGVAPERERLCEAF